MLHAARAVAALLALAVALLLAPAPVAAQVVPGDAFQPGDCVFDLPAGATEGQNIECGWLRVPARHADPDGPQLELAVAIIRSQAASPAGDPLVMLQGGPGGSTIDTYVQAYFFPNSRLTRLDRDLVLFDQRGTLYTEPSLVCPELWQLVEETIELRLSDEEGQRLAEQALAECRGRLADEGVDLGVFNSVESAADVALLAEALGYEQINLYGVSYGSLLAQHVMRDHPGVLRSVILDAVVPTETNYIVEVPRNEQRAFDTLYAACAADAGCARAYPNLKQTFDTTFERLEAEPATVPMTDTDTGMSYDAVFDGDAFAGAIYQLMYSSDFVPALPRIIADASRGEFDVLAQVLPLIYFDRTFSQGQHYSVVCAEDGDFQVSDADLAGLDPRIAEDGVESLEFYLDSCELFDVPDLGPAVDAPVTADIPTLVLSGQFDPITPPAFGETVAQQLPQAYAFTFPNTGHGALTSSDCAVQIARDFLAEPGQAPDGACVAAAGPPSFISPATVIFSETPFSLVTLKLNQLLPFGIFLLSLAGLATLLLVWPVAWLVRLVRGRPAPPRQLGATLARWLGVLAATAALVYLGWMLFETVRLALANDATVFFGLPRSSLLLAGLPSLLAVLAIGMVAAAAIAWQRGYWSALGRAYYSFLALAAVGCVVGLAWAGLLGVGLG